MRILAVLNRDGGTLRGIDVDAFAERSCATLTDAGHRCEVVIVDGDGLLEALEAAVASTECDVILAGGGDGTISAAAATVANTEKALAVLPAGTMNLFARGLGIPQNIDAAVKAFATGELREVDLARANGTAFVHQFSIGMHPKMLHERERISFRSRAGKMLASLRAVAETFWNPPRMRVEIDTPDFRRTVSVASIGVTNNLFGEGHLPYAEMPSEGVLGIYVARTRRRRDVAKFLFNIAIGRWRRNDQVEIIECRRARLTVLAHAKRFKCSIDGELRPLDETTELESLPGALRVLVPAGAAQASGGSSPASPPAE